jgi:glycosyltransferase domain-containing protein
MNRSSELTIVLTLKDRVEFTWRWLAYAERCALPFKVLIADGGADEAVGSVLRDPDHYPRVDYEYLRYPYDATYSDYYAKVADAVARVRTPYVVLADNDDLFVVDGLAKSIEFLSGHSDYVACAGQCAAFWVGSPRAEASRARLYDERVDWKFSNNARSQASPTARARVRNQSLGADDIFYHVLRAPELARQLGLVKAFDPSDLFLVEQLISYLSAIAGKIMQLDTLYIARQQNSPGSSGGEHQAKYGGWWSRMLVPTWSRDFGRFLDITAAELARADGIEIEEAKSWIVDSYRLSVAPSLLADILHEETITPMMPVVAQIVRRVVQLDDANVFRRALRAIYRRSRWISFDAVYATEFLAAPASNASREFKVIREFLTRDQPTGPTSGT